MPKICDIDDNRLIALREAGATDKQLASAFNASIPTLKKRITQLQFEQGIILEWKSLRHIEFAKLQSAILESINEDTIREAPLGERIKALESLHKAESLDTGNTKAVKGLFDQFVTIAQERQKENESVDDDIDIHVHEAQYTEVPLPDNGLPNL